MLPIPSASITALTLRTILLPMWRAGPRTRQELQGAEELPGDDPEHGGRSDHKDRYAFRGSQKGNDPCRDLRNCREAVGSEEKKAHGTGALSMSREKWISVRVTEEENRAIEEKMKQHGILNRGAYIRKMAIDGYCLSLEVKELQKLATLLGRYGNNLNQVAKRANTFGDIYRQDIRELKDQLAEMQGLMKQILTKISEYG